MTIKFYKPQNPLLQKYIERYYFFENSGNLRKFSYLGFPTHNVYVTIFGNAKIKIKGSDVTIKGMKKQHVSSLLFFDTEIPGLNTYDGKTSEVTIYFKPLGLNAFLEKNLSFYKQSSVSEFSPYNDYNENMLRFFKLKNPQQKIAFLEEYLLSKLKKFHHSFLHKIIHDILKEDSSTIKTSELAKRNNISRTTLNRQFALHLGISPNKFIKIARFRKAIDMLNEESKRGSLIDTAFLTGYFDQSHMVKDFKTLTGYSPKSFFSKVSKIHNKQLSWMFK